MTVSQTLPPRFPNPRELCSTEGAKTIAREIERYWAARGFKIVTTIVGMSAGAERGGAMGVRSNLLNGRPPE